MSEDHADEQAGGRFGRDKREKELANRQLVAEQDLSSFMVNLTGGSNGDVSNYQGKEQEYDDSFQMQEDDPASAMLMQAKPFDGATFNALEPDSWASFAIRCQQMMGYIPSNQEMLAWIMKGMTMLGAAAAVKGVGANDQMDTSVQSHMSRGSVRRSITPPRESSKAVYAGRPRLTESPPASEWETRESIKTSEHESKQLPEPSKDHSSDAGEGEADMDMTPDDG